MILTVGTRGSKLSLIQTNAVIKSLKFFHPELEVKVKVIKTTGDKERGKPLFTIDRKGIFEKEIDVAVVKGEVDFAVHSLKDVPITENLGTKIVAIPKRFSPHDVLFSKNIPLKKLPKGGVIGTSSLRRMAQVKFLHPDLEVKPIRGNVETRIAKVNRGEFDGVILAEAGLDRMGMKDLVTERLPIYDFTPAAGQGALAVVTKENNEGVIELLSSINDPLTKAEVTAERSLVFALKGGCRVPIGVIGRANDKSLSLYGCVFSVDTCKKIFSTAEGHPDEAERLGGEVAQSLLEKGAKAFEIEWRKKYGVW
ncbi:MAG: hydroxymethylbilane synthase [Candidatus Methylarchaceae archaeon HK02M2]|nr:hydroxymethylbilane synthase [Candidatus Methylarchaceae archaeon HK02M2]